MRSVQIYIEGERDSNNYSEIELFKDETIGINLSVQNIQDISKVFTDFSQSFTVPASAVNNAVFKHYYENAVDLDPTLIDQRLRRNAYIEIDRTPFRSGKIQLEKANLKEGHAESYTITFYGDLVTLKDLFGEDKLSDLIFEDYDHVYTGAEVYNRITDNASNYDVRYPLISSDRLWTYGDATSTDISTSSGRIDYTELFPAVKVARIFDVIQSTYDIIFNGLFLTDKRFTDLFLLAKNSIENKVYSSVKTIDITGGNSKYFKYASDEVNMFSGAIAGGVEQADVTLTVYNVSNTSVNWYVEVYINDVFQRLITNSGNKTVTLSSKNNGRLKCNIYSDGVLTFNSRYTYIKKETTFVPSPPKLTVTSFNSVNASNSLTITSDLKNKMPEIKVADFFSGVLKMFNLTCYAQNVNTFEIEPLDYWYQKGAIIDVTKHIDIDSIEVAKVPLYKRLDFSYEESKSFNNILYKQSLSREYGNLSNGFEYDGGEFNVKLPFENLRFEKFTSTNLTVAYTLEEQPDYKSYNPKPILLYMYDIQSTDATGFKFYNGSTEQTINNYMPFGQDLLSNGYNYSLNFGEETSTLLESSVPYSLYNVYYRDYIDNIFNYKNRLTKVKAIFPTSLITSLKLNDRLIIRDKRYIINSIGSTLTNGEVQLELINDFREILNYNIFTVPNTSGIINVPILVPNGINDINVTTSSTGVTLGSTTNFTSDGILEVNYSSNPDTLFTMINENGDTEITEYYEELRSEEGTEFLIELNLEFTKINGDVTNEPLIIIQEAQ